MRPSIFWACSNIMTSPRRATEPPTDSTSRSPSSSALPKARDPLETVLSNLQTLEKLTKEPCLQALTLQHLDPGMWNNDEFKRGALECLLMFCEAETMLTERAASEVSNGAKRRVSRQKVAPKKRSRHT